MKYLIFNVAVFLALGYLIVGADAPAVLTEKATQAARLMEREAPAPAAEPAQQVVRQPIAAPVVEKTPDPVTEIDPLTPKPAPALPQEVVKVETPVAKKVPPPTVEPKAPEPVVMSVETPENQLKETSEDRLETVRQRSRDLRDMAAEMETLFAEKISW